MTAIERVGRERWEVQEADHWQVRLSDGTLMFATLNHGPEGKCGYYLELVFMPENPEIVGPIAGRVIEAVEGVY